jgi:hypothetical protein
METHAFDVVLEGLEEFHALRDAGLHLSQVSVDVFDLLLGGVSVQADLPWFSCDHALASHKTAFIVIKELLLLAVLFVLVAQDGHGFELVAVAD